MLATVLVSTFTILIIIGLLAALFLALRDASRKSKSKNKTAENQPPPKPPHPLEWLLHLLLAFMFAGIGAWHFAHPDELMGGGNGMAVILGLAYLALGQYGPGIAALAAAAGFLAICVWQLRSQD